MRFNDLSHYIGLGSLSDVDILGSVALSASPVVSHLSQGLGVSLGRLLLVLVIFLFSVKGKFKVKFICLALTFTLLSDLLIDG